MVILLSTRGTAGSDIWFMCLADRPMVRSYHLGDYDWTPLSQNPAQKCDDTVSASELGGPNTRASRARGWGQLLLSPGSSVGVAHVEAAVTGRGMARPGAVSYPSHQHWGAKSFVDDLAGSRGVVPSRAAALLRSNETNPFWLDDLSAINRIYLRRQANSVGQRGRVRERERKNVV